MKQEYSILQDKKLSCKEFVYWLFNHLDKNLKLSYIKIKNCYITGIPKNIPYLIKIEKKSGKLFGFTITDHVIITGCNFVYKIKS